jgi:hypothetical protein
VDCCHCETKKNWQIQGVMVFVSPLLTCGTAYPWICSLDPHQTWLGKIHHVKKSENMGKNLGKAQENMGKSPINGGF